MIKTKKTDCQPICNIKVCGGFDGCSGICNLKILNQKSVQVLKSGILNTTWIIKSNKFQYKYDVDNIQQSTNIIFKPIDGGPSLSGTLINDEILTIQNGASIIDTGTLFLLDKTTNIYLSLGGEVSISPINCQQSCLSLINDDKNCGAGGISCQVDEKCCGQKCVKLNKDDTCILRNCEKICEEGEINCAGQCISRYRVYDDCQCKPGYYGEQCFPQEEVFQVDTSGYNKTSDQAEGVCNQYDSTVATSSQLNSALKTGAQWCSIGWTKDDSDNNNFVGMYPMQGSAPKCGDGGYGVRTWTPANELASVNCYGLKPPSGALPYFQSTTDQSKNIYSYYNTPCTNKTDPSDFTKCLNGWSGDNCSICGSNWSGKCCDIACSGNGNFQNGKCVCNNGFNGDNCQYSNSITCSGHGTVNSAGICTCNGNWTDANCSKCPINFDNTDTFCNKCANGYYGPNCQQQCPKCGKDSFCLKLQSGPLCICKYGWILQDSASKTNYYYVKFQKYDNNNYIFHFTNNDNKRFYCILRINTSDNNLTISSVMDMGNNSSNGTSGLWNGAILVFYKTATEIGWQNGPIKISRNNDTCINATMTPIVPFLFQNNPIGVCNNNMLCILSGCSGSSDGYLYILFTSGFTFDFSQQDAIKEIKGSSYISCNTTASNFINTIWRQQAGVESASISGNLYGTSTAQTEIIVNYKVINKITNKQQYIRIYHSSSNYNIGVSTIDSINFNDFGQPEYSNYKVFPATGTGTPAVVIIGPPL